MSGTTNVSDLYITFVRIGVFRAGMLAVLCASRRKSECISEYAVGDRSYGPWLIAMCYPNSRRPCATFTPVFAQSVGGALGLYVTVCAALGDTALYPLPHPARALGIRVRPTPQPGTRAPRCAAPALTRSRTAAANALVSPTDPTPTLTRSASGRRPCRHALSHPNNRG
ncbi:hypothetical protein EWW49_27655 [Pseudomonas syringae]|nr:hypothetical protein EWW49_27655 [Pseudomonas syringae]